MITTDGARARSRRQTYERLGHSRRVPLPVSCRARRCHGDNRFCNKLGDRIVSVGDAYLNQGGFISGLHDLDFIGAEGTVSNQFVDRHSESPSLKNRDRHLGGIGGPLVAEQSGGKRGDSDRPALFEYCTSEATRSVR
jgi:hypothetical protein